MPGFRPAVGVKHLQSLCGLTANLLGLFSVSKTVNEDTVKVWESHPSQSVARVFTDVRGSPFLKQPNQRPYGLPKAQVNQLLRCFNDFHFLSIFNHLYQLSPIGGGALPVLLRQ